MRVWSLRLVLALLLITVCTSQKLNGQTTTSGALAGVITDQTNAVIVGADVQLKDNAKGTTQSTKTDREGVYQFSFLVPGKYTLTVAHTGFGEERRAVNVLLGPAVSVNLQLTVAKTSSEIRVIDEAPLLQAENGDVSATVSQTQISEVPNPGNDLTYIVQTSPGVVMNTDIGGGNGGIFSILGMPGTSYLYTVDGLNETSTFGGVPFKGVFGLLLGQNAAQETTVVSTGYSGQFGEAAGGNINYSTKSGTSEFHGNAQYYWNGDALATDYWFFRPFGIPHPFSAAHQWASSFGGPIKKEKVFFFVDTEGLRTLVRNLNLSLIPSPQFEDATLANIEADKRFGAGSATDLFYKKIFDLYKAAPGASSAQPGVFNSADLGCGTFSALGPNTPCVATIASVFGRPSYESLISGRMDWNVSSKDRAFLRVQYDWGHTPAYDDGINSAFNLDVYQTWWQAQIVETHTFGSWGANQFLLAASDPTYRGGVKELSKTLATFPTQLNLLPFYANLGGALLFHDNHPRYQLSDDATMIRRRHKVGFGASFERSYWSNSYIRPESFGIISPLTLDAFYQGGLDPAVFDVNAPDPNPDFTQLFQTFDSDPYENVSTYTLSVYGEDQWRARANLTFTLALRAEHQSNPVCENRCFARLAGPFASISHDLSQPYDKAILSHQKRAYVSMDAVRWSPRFSFAWQPFGVSHNTVLRGGAGIFYDPVAEDPVFDLSSNPPDLNSYTVSNDNLTPAETPSNLFKTAADSSHAFINAFANGENLAQILTTVPNFVPPGIRVAGNRMHAPQYQKWSLEVQQAFGAATTLRVGYFGHHGIHEYISNPSANAYCDPSMTALESGAANPCFGFISSMPLTVPDARFSAVSDIGMRAVSNYSGMVVSFQHRFSGWAPGLFQANYTYGHALDEVSNGGIERFTFGSSASAQDASNLRGAYGSADNDVRHSLNANYVWEVPIKAALRGRGPDSLVKGWQLSGTLFVRTGFPYTVFDSLESTALTSNNYEGQIYGVPAGPLDVSRSCGKGAAFPLAPHPCQVPQYLADGSTLNPNARFVQAGCETGFDRGTLPGTLGPCDGPSVSLPQGRNRFRAASYFDTDLSIMKTTKIPRWENATLAIGFQFFNLFNHPNFGLPDSNIASSTFGQIFYLEGKPNSVLGGGSGIGAVRTIQVKGELKF
jgi:Carboxypeptidase regulatory-like domain